MDALENEYTSIYPHLSSLSTDIEGHLKEYLSKYPRIDRITARAKSIDRFVQKAKKEKDGVIKYQDPLIQIQDQVGARIITYYLQDVEEISKLIHSYYEPIEEIEKKPASHDAFSYLGRHFILFIPDELRVWDKSLKMPNFFELQIKTLFQHAWAESEHDLNYKSFGGIEVEDKRLIAFSAAQAWGADKVFDQLFTKYNHYT